VVDGVGVAFRFLRDRSQTCPSLLFPPLVPRFDLVESGQGLVRPGDSGGADCSPAESVRSQYGRSSACSSSRASSRRMAWSWLSRRSAPTLASSTSERQASGPICRPKNSRSISPLRGGTDCTGWMRSSFRRALPDRVIKNVDAWVRLEPRRLTYPCRSSSASVGAARDHLADVLRSTIQPGPKSTARLCTAASRWPAVIGTTPSAEHRDRPALGRPPRRRGSLNAPAVEADHHDAEMERLVGADHGPTRQRLGPEPVSFESRLMGGRLARRQRPRAHLENE
jgi:hypothetical protein